jgi:hypothetical protein
MIEVPVQRVIDELKMQRNQALDALAIAGARITSLEAQLKEKEKSDASIQNP